MFSLLSSEIIIGGVWIDTDITVIYYTDCFHLSSVYDFLLSFFCIVLFL